MLVDAYELDRGLEWLERFADTLGTYGDGEIVRGPGRTSPNVGFLEPVPTAFVLYTTEDLTTIPQGTLHEWSVDAEVTSALAEEALGWVYGRGTRQFLTREDPDWCIETVGIEHDAAVAEGVFRYGWVSPASFREEPLRLRQVDFNRHGRAVYQIVDPAITWDVHVEDLRKRILLKPAVTDYACIAQSTGNRMTWAALEPAFVTTTDIRYNRPLLAQFVPDVYGVQLLTEAHLQRAIDLSSWTVEEHPGGRFLVQAKDLAPWYASPQPTAEIVAAARADFGPMILTPAAIEANPWRRPG